MNELFIIGHRLFTYNTYYKTFINMAQLLLYKGKQE